MQQISESKYTYLLTLYDFGGGFRVMPTTYLKETIVSLIQLISLYVIVSLWMLLSYLIVFWVPGLTGIVSYSSSLNGGQYIGLPPVGWFIPLLLSCLFGVAFGQYPDEYMAFPNSVLNLIATICHFYCSIEIVNRLSSCLTDSSASCDFITAVLFIVALFIHVVVLYVTLSLIGCYIRYSQAITANLEYIYFNAYGYARANEEIANS